MVYTCGGSFFCLKKINNFENITWLQYTAMDKGGVILKRTTLILFCLIFSIVLVGCSKTPMLNKGNTTCSLTGLECTSANNPTIMMMINNARSARPQTGLNRADVVVEMLAEGEITRFAAFYQSDMNGTVGPVRSVREYFYDLAKGAKAEVVSAGGSKDALARIKEEGYSHIDGIHAEEKYFSRVSFRRPPHNLYTNFDRMKQAMKDKGFNEVSPAKYTFSPEAVTAKGQRAQTLHLRYHRLYDCGYRYSAKSGNYVRYTEGEQQVDRDTSQPVAMQNVLIIYAQHRMADSLGHRSIAITGSGKGFLVQKGKYIPIEWRFRDGLIVPFSEEGKELTLLPGKTWVNVLPETGKVELY